MSVFTLKCLAMLTMLCDHAGLFLMGNSLPMRCIGRFSFIAYAFLLAEGYVHTRSDRNAVRKHLRLLLLLLIPSELAFDYALYGRVSFAGQSVILTLLIGYCFMITAQGLESAGHHKLLTAALMIAASLLAYLLRSDYSLAGVLLICAFYFYAQAEQHLSLKSKLLCLFFLGICYTALESWVRFHFCPLSEYLEKNKSYLCWNAATVLSFLPFAAFNGKRGSNPPFFRNLYKSFYPLHLFVIILIREIFH